MGMKTLIAIEAENFIRDRGIPAHRISLEAGIAPGILTRVLSGSRKDMTSTNADKLRAAMRRLSAAVEAPATTPESQAAAGD